MRSQTDPKARLIRNPDWSEAQADPKPRLIQSLDWSKVQTVWEEFIKEAIQKAKDNIRKQMRVKE